MSDKNLTKVLTKQLILAKTKANNLGNIKNLNLWGNDLEDLSILQIMPQLQVISLSVNKISSLRDFRNCSKLQQLYLRKNNISDISEIKYLMKLPVLKVLWLHDNPCAQQQNYRALIIKHLPNLDKLDNNPIQPSQRQALKNIKNVFTAFNEKQQAKHIQPQQQKDYRQQKEHKESKVLPGNKDERYKIDDMNRNKNILMAVLSLMRQLDVNSLSIVKRQADNFIQDQC